MGGGFKIAVLIMPLCVAGAFAQTSTPATPPGLSPEPAIPSSNPSASPAAPPSVSTPAPAPTAPAMADSTAPAAAGASQAQPPVTKLTCKASRGDLGIFEPLRFMSLTIDVKNKYVKMVHEGDGKVFEYTDGAASAQGHKSYVTVTDDSVVYGQGRDAWKIDRYTGTLTNPSIGFPLDCQLRAPERKF
jgi:hypothetical protein